MTERNQEENRRSNPVRRAMFGFDYSISPGPAFRRAYLNMKKSISKSAEAWPTLILAMSCFLGCGNPSVLGTPGVPKPIKVLENPQTGERVRLYKEIWFKKPKGYDESKHIAEWTESGPNHSGREVSRKRSCQS